MVARHHHCSHLGYRPEMIGRATVPGAVRRVARRTSRPKRPARRHLVCSSAFRLWRHVPHGQAQATNIPHAKACTTNIPHAEAWTTNVARHTRALPVFSAPLRWKSFQRGHRTRPARPACPRHHKPCDAIGLNGFFTPGRQDAKTQGREGKILVVWQLCASAPLR